MTKTTTEKGRRNFWIHIAMGPVLMLLSILLIPESVFPTFSARCAIGTVA